MLIIISFIIFTIQKLISNEGATNVRNELRTGFADKTKRSVEYCHSVRNVLNDGKRVKECLNTYLLPYYRYFIYYILYIIELSHIYE